MIEIVGIVINGMILTGPNAILAVKILGNYDELVCRNRAKFMAAADVGHKWEQLANSPTLFLIDEKEQP